MRFGRRRTRPSLNLTPERTDADNSPTNFIPGCWVIRWSSPFSISQNTCTFNRNSASEGVTHYVPKCITSVSQSDILCGDRVENFSSDCWLQNHLDQFGHNVQPHPAIPEEIEADYDDDSPIVSTPSTEANSISSFEIDNSFEDEMVNRLYYAYSNLTDIASYTNIVEPPPYGIQDLPPSYEEAVADDQQRGSRRSTTSNSSSEVDFMWY